jgi:hypothetical protein
LGISIVIFAKNFIVGHAPWDFCSSEARAQHFQASSLLTTISQYINIIVIAELDFSFDSRENNHYQNMLHGSKMVPWKTAIR